MQGWVLGTIQSSLEDIMIWINLIIEIDEVLRGEICWGSNGKYDDILIKVNGMIIAIIIIIMIIFIIT